MRNPAIARALPAGRPTGASLTATGKEMAVAANGSFKAVLVHHVTPDVFCHVGLERY